jgi:hypothetical protein
MNYIDIRIHGNKETLTNFLVLLAKIRYLGSVGASRDIVVNVDGDGIDRLNFEQLLDGKELFMGLEEDEEGNILNRIYHKTRIPFGKEVQESEKLSKHYLST